MFERSRLRSVAGRALFFVGLATALIAGEAQAADTGNGSKNFSAPQSVPNYFSNEAGPMQGPASETQRGPIYMGQTYGALQQPRPAAAAVEVRPDRASKSSTGSMIAQALPGPDDSTCVIVAVVGS